MKLLQAREQCLHWCECCSVTSWIHCQKRNLIGLLYIYRTGHFSEVLFVLFYETILFSAIKKFFRNLRTAVRIVKNTSNIFFFAAIPRVATAGKAMCEHLALNIAFIVLPHSKQVSWLSHQSTAVKSQLRWIYQTV